MNTTTETGLVRGATVELENAVPDLEGKRVRVVLEPLEESELSASNQRDLWRVWIDRGPHGPIEEGHDTSIP